MQISKVKISNYRGIKEDEFNTSPFVCIIGENNAGKSTVLLGISLFFSGTSLSQSDFYDIEEPITIEVTFKNIAEGDKLRLAAEHRNRIDELIIEGELVLTRKYVLGSRPELLCKRLSPKDPNFDLVETALAGKRGRDVELVMSGLLPNFATDFQGINSQKAAKEKVAEISASLSADEKEMKLSSLPTGIPESIYSFLPEPIYIAAVKDLKDEVKTKESTSFGKLLGILLKSLEGSEDLKEILDSFDQLHVLLNRINTEAGVQDKRIRLLQSMEQLISSYLKENFPRAEVELEIPKPELKQVFSNAKILVDDGVKDLVETKGDGLKRSVTFALLRSYVEHSNNQKKKEQIEQNQQIAETENEDMVVEIPQPYIFLFEEPELFLHPNAQLILFEALEKLAQIGNQVFVTTHSPLFFSPRATGTFIKIIKQYPNTGKPFGQLVTVNLLEEIEAKDAFQIICFENNAAAFFSHKVLLVEGDSDLIYLKEIAKKLNEDWRFDYRNIPIISIDGKSNVKRFIDFYNKFGIQVYSLLDADAMIDGFEKFEVPEEIKEKRAKLLSVLDQIALERQASAVLTADKIKEVVRRYTWKQRYDNLKSLAKKVTAGHPLSEDEICEVNLLFAEEDNSLRRQVFTDSSIRIDQKDALLCDLMQHNIFVLSKGAIECYYPPNVTGADKPTKALNAIEILKGIEDAKDFLPKIKYKEKDHCELELIFSNIFR